MLRSVFLSSGLTLLLAWCVGCGQSELPFNDNSKDAEAFAKSIKQLVLSTAEQVRAAPQPADTIRVIVQTLSELDVCPTGDYLKTYQQIHTISSDLLVKCEQGKPADFQAKLNEIVELAKSLPGEVSVDKNARKDK